MVKTRARTKEKGEKQAVIPVRFTQGEVKRIEQARKMMGMPFRSSFIRRAVLEKIDELQKMRLIQVRDVTKEEATNVMLRYLERNPGVHYVSELIERLGLEPKVAFEAATQLILDGRARLNERR